MRRQQDKLWHLVANVGLIPLTSVIVNQCILQLPRSSRKLARSVSDLTVSLDQFCKHIIDKVTCEIYNDTISFSPTGGHFDKQRWCCDWQETP